MKTIQDLQVLTQKIFDALSEILKEHNIRVLGDLILMDPESGLALGTCLKREMRKEDIENSISILQRLHSEILTRHIRQIAKEN